MTTDKLPTFDATELVDDVDVPHPDADSIQFVLVDDDKPVYLYLWDTDRDEPVTAVAGFDAEGIEKLQQWLINVDVEARQATSEYSNPE